MSKRLLSIYLVLVVLVAGLIPGCTGGGGYNLTMAVAPTGGGTATDETGTSPYAQGAVVDIEAVAAAGYEFVNWSAPAGTFADANAAITTFTMPAQDVIVTANFALVYDLTMVVNPAAGGTATDETGASPYPQGTVVDIKAVAAAGYEFVNWSAPAGTFADANAAITTFTMPAQNVIVTANFALVYDLTMAVNPAGSGTATDETGTSPYPAGTDVSIKAVANSPYQFFKWTAPAGTFSDEYVATTTFTMPAEDVTVTAHFVGPLDHFTAYVVDEVTAPYIGEVVEVKDQFVALNVTVGSALGFANAAQKEHLEETFPIFNPDHHLTVYEIEGYEAQAGMWQVAVENQFGLQYLTVYGPVVLAVPTQKEDHGEPLGLDHYLMYGVMEAESVDEYVNLADQFGEFPEVQVYQPVAFASPAQKTYKGEVTEIRDPDSHAVIYAIEPISFEKTVQVANQFGDEQVLDLTALYGLAVPSQKKAFAPLLDHFQCYAAEDSSGIPISADVVLEDQLGVFQATVDFATTFANPAGKWPEGGSQTPIWDFDHHFTIYDIVLEGEPGTWAVGVANQFGGMQPLEVSGPVALAVPTQKAGHEFPVGLDHFLLYTVTMPPPVDRNVQLWDQFLPEWTWHGVTTAAYLGVPVKKTHGSEVTEIVNPEAHLVFYNITPNAFTLPGLLTNNQFGEQLLDVQDPYMLAVPSLKLYVDPMS
jgi:hypothetical protein